MIAIPENIRRLNTPKPLVLITGFLGAGKTTFLRALLKATSTHRLSADVILNDYENAHLDSETLREYAASIEPLAAACACCEGLETLVDLSITASGSRNDLLFIELNGTADPVPMLESFTLLESKLMRQPRWQVCIVDSREFAKRGSHQSLRELQLETASHFHLSHTENLTTGARNILYGRIRAINPTATETTPELLAEALSRISSRLQWRQNPESETKSLFSHGSNHRHHLAHLFTGCQILLPERLPRIAVWSWLAALPLGVIRAKALVSPEDEPGIRRLFERVGTELMADPLEVSISPRVPPSAILIGPELNPGEILSSARRILSAECSIP